MVAKKPGITSKVLPWCQGFQKGNICGGTMTKWPSRCLKSSKTPVFWTFLTFLIILMVTKKPGITSRVLPWSQEFQKGITCMGTMTKCPSRHSKSSKTPVFWTFLTFLIILMVTKNPRITSRVLPWCQGFQKGNICGGTMTKWPSRCPKSSKTPCFGHSWHSWSSWWCQKIYKTLPKYSHGPKDSKNVTYSMQEQQYGTYTLFV